MILLDLNQVMISNLMMQLQNNNDEIEEYDTSYGS